LLCLIDPSARSVDCVAKRPDEELGITIENQDSTPDLCQRHGVERHASEGHSRIARRVGEASEPRGCGTGEVGIGDHHRGQHRLRSNEPGRLVDEIIVLRHRSAVHR
jgi:hypothetical protein